MTNVLDRIISEIESCKEEEEPHLCDYRHHRNEGLEMAISIIDKYRQEPCEDCISRQAVEGKLKALVNEMETIFADIRESKVDDSVCGLCEYDCDHGIDGYANECPGFERDDCFKLKDEYRKEWESINELPSVTPQKPKTGHWIPFTYTIDAFFKGSVPIAWMPLPEPYKEGQRMKDDCISRKYLLSIASEDGAYGYVSAYDIANAPPVTPQEPETGRWIPVSERLPEDHETVLALLSSDRLTKASYRSHKLPFSDKPIGWGYGRDGYIDFVNEKVIAWMPLPEPYKESEE